jgi:hypothetical protein
MYLSRLGDELAQCGNSRCGFGWELPIVYLHELIAFARATINVFDRLRTSLCPEAVEDAALVA